MIAEAKIRRLMILLQATNFSLHACRATGKRQIWVYLAINVGRTRLQIYSYRFKKPMNDLLQTWWRHFGLAKI